MIEELWACEKEFLARYSNRMLNATSEDERIAANLFNIDTDERPSIFTTGLGENGDIAKIEIFGALSKKGPSGLSRLFRFRGTSYTDIIEALEEVGSIDSIKKVRLIMDTPGGEVNGVDEVFGAVQELAKKKEVIAENHGLLASAGYWLASAATRIEAISPVVETGSIGVYVLVIDFSKMDERVGVKEIRIVSKNAPKKNPDVATKGGRDVLQERIDAIERVFISRVAEGRKVSTDVVKEKFGQGSVMIAQDPDGSIPDALSTGMIDSVLGSKVFIQNSIDKDPKVTNKMGKENKSSFDRQVTTNNKGEQMPSLKELLAEHPALSAEIEALEKKAFEAGNQLAKERIETGAKILNSEYPQFIKDIASKVMSGEADPSMLEGAIQGYDITQEKIKAEQAKKESEGTPDTPPDPQSNNDETDYQAQLAAFRAERGMEV